MNGGGRENFRREKKLQGTPYEGFIWIPSLAGPTTIAARHNGSGIYWLFPFVDGHPPLGWSDTFVYLVLPVLLVVSQIQIADRKRYSGRYLAVAPPSETEIDEISGGWRIHANSNPLRPQFNSNDPNMKNTRALTKFLPLMIGYFALSVPSGLSLYCTTSLASKVGEGAKNPAKQLNDDIFKEEQARLQKSLSELNASRKEAKREENCYGLVSRFKQLNELESRRKQQREEERRKAQEAAAEVDQLTKEGHEIEGSIIDKENGFGTGLGTKTNETYQSVTNQGASNVGVVNGDLSSPNLKEDQKEGFFI
ncbi:Inner membrane protein PPF-1 [Hibiscus syriacus]|uniref:Inner membrane protein PPF-1 n=1 Tax=Hibiscus syriacus TaxID=106335 RepID=A0A6A3AV60_HIBSY|nr:Inner membrane protein PPF-1 [Hibiscus syriacus]